MKTLPHAKKTIEKWRRILGIDPAWTIGVGWIPAGRMDDAEAAVDMNTTGYYQAEIGLALEYQDFHKWLPHADRLIVHELLHIVLSDLTMLAEVCAQDSLRPELERREEQAITKLTTALVTMYQAGLLE